VDAAASRQARGGGSARPSPRVAGSSEWGDVSFLPESDPLPLELFDELGGKEVELVVMNAAVRPTFSGEKSVVLSCRIFRDGEPRMVPTSHGPIPLDLPCYFRLPVRADGVPYVPTRSKFYATWSRCNGNMRPTRRDRMPLSVFKAKILRGRVRIVKTGSTQQHQQLPQELWRLIIEDVAP